MPAIAYADLLSPGSASTTGKHTRLGNGRICDCSQWWLSGLLVAVVKKKAGRLVSATVTGRCAGADVPFFFHEQLFCRVWTWWYGYAGHGHRYCCLPGDVGSKSKGKLLDDIELPVCN